MAQLCSRLMKNYPTIKLENIVSHHEAHLRGYASGHADCDHWLAKFGYDMNWFRELVKNNGEIPEKYTITAIKSFEDRALAEANKTRLERLGFDVEITKEGK